VRQVSGNTLQQVEKLSTYSGDIYEWRKAERQKIDTRVDKDNAVLRELYRSVDKTGAFKHRKAVRF